MLFRSSCLALKSQRSKDGDARAGAICPSYKSCACFWRGVQTANRAEGDPAGCPTPLCPSAPLHLSQPKWPPRSRRALVPRRQAAINRVWGGIAHRPSLRYIKSAFGPAPVLGVFPEVKTLSHWTIPPRACGHCSALQIWLRVLRSGELHARGWKIQSERQVVTLARAWQGSRPLTLTALSLTVARG